MANARRHELVDGEIVTMAPSINHHGTLVLNLGIAIGNALRERSPCRVQTEAGIVRPERDDRFFQADRAVTCTPSGRNGHAVANPILIVEVLSPSTEDHDRKVKVPDYREIPSVREIVLIDRRRAYVEVIRRLDESRWLTVLVLGPDAVLHLDSIPLDLPMAELYRNVEVEVPADEPAEGVIS